MSRYAVSRYGYDYSLTPARPTGWRATFTNFTIFATVMAVSAISGVVVALELFASPAPPAIVASAVVAPPHAPQAVAQTVTQATLRSITQRLALATTPKSAPAPVSTPAIADAHVAPPATVAAAPAVQVAAAVQPAPVPPTVAAQASQPTPIADNDLTFAKGYAQRQAIARGAPVRHGKVIVEAKAQLGRPALKSKPKVYARNTNTMTPDDQRRVAAAQRPDAFGMFQRFDRPDQSDTVHHQALAFGEQRTTRRNDAPRAATPPYGNSPNGLFGGLF
jgi:hypothetical protein